MNDEKITVTDIITVVMYEIGANKKHRSYQNSDSYERKNELIYILKGTNKVHFAGTDGVETEGCVRVLPKGIYPNDALYTVDTLKDTDEADLCIDIFFDTDRPIDSKMLIVNCSGDKKLRSLFEKLHQIWLTKYEGYYFKSMSILYEILDIIRKTHSAYLPKEKSKLIQPAIDYINSNFTSGGIDCDYLAQLCGISYTYFKKLFVKRLGFTPSKFIIKKRIELACELLITDNMKIKTVAQMTGFENVYYFSKMFKQQLGVCPSDYSKKRVLV